MDLISLLKYAVRLDASDLHLMHGLSPVLRIHGEIIVTDLPIVDSAEMMSWLQDNLSDDRKAKLERDLQLCYSIKKEDLGFFRVSVYFEQGVLGLAIRVGKLEVMPFDKLGLPPVVSELVRRPSGLILITGPTGSGKTTTMNALIDLINRERRCKVITVEDPIEYVHPNKRSLIIQQELYTDAHTFHSALVHILRQDPDVIAVGEMRDLETISTAVTAAETGHLVISTLHTPDAAQTVNRIIDVFPANQQNQVRMQLSACLTAIVSQQLLPRMDIPGRVAACEVLIANHAIRTLIREDKAQQIRHVIETGTQDGMQTLDSSLRKLYQEGIITYDAAASKMVDLHSVEMLRSVSPEPSAIV